MFAIVVDVWVITADCQIVMPMRPAWFASQYV